MERPWLRAYSPQVPESLDYTRVPLYRFLQDAAARFPDRTAILYYDGEGRREICSKSYRDLDDESDRFASALAALGIAKGDRVLQFLENSPALVASFYGILKAGAVVAPCNPTYRAQELAGQLRDSGARALLCEPGLYPLVREVAGQIDLEHILVTGDPPPPGTYSMDALVGSHEPLRDYPAIVPEEDLALLPYTGGTTGVPKASMLTHFNLVANTLQFRCWFQYRQGEEVFIGALPLFHIGGLAGAMTVPVAAAGTVVLFRRFHPHGVLQAIQDYRASRFPGVPTMYIAILGLEGSRSFDLTSLRPSRTSAAALPKAVKEAFDTLVGHEVLIEGYGLTETSPLTHANPIHRARAGSIGVPLPDTDARIVDPEEGTKVLPVGQTGELVVRGPQVMRGYLNRP